MKNCRWQIADCRLKNLKSPHPIPLPSGARGRVRGSLDNEIWNLGFEI